MSDCPSAAHGTSRDPYGCYEREQQDQHRMLQVQRAAWAAASEPVAAARNLLDVLDGITVGRRPQALEDAMERLRSALRDT